MTAPSEAPPANGAPQPRRPSGGLLFRSPAESPLDEPTTDQLPGEGSPSGELPDGSSSASAWSSDELPEDHDDGPSSSRGSSADSVRPLAAKAQRAAARQAVKIAGSMAHQYLARDEAAQAVGLYLIDDETAQQIGDPLARIAARHAPVDGGVANPDVADGIAAMLGVAKFVSITIEKSSQAAALRMTAAPAPEPVDV